jgi:hypothetical protein
MEQILDIQLFSNFKSDHNLVARILDLTQASYITNKQLIEREIEHNSESLYLKYQDDSINFINKEDANYY